MFHSDYMTKRHKRTYPNWSEVPDPPYRKLIVGGSGSGIQMHYLI